LADLSYPQQQFVIAALVAAAWMAIELVPERWWSRRRELVTRAARYLGGTVVASSALIFLRRHIDSTEPAMMWAVFLAVTLGAAVLLRHPQYLRRCAPKAGPDELGVLRFGIGLILAFMVARDDLVSTLLLPESMVRHHGLVWMLDAKLGDGEYGHWLLDIRDPTWVRLVYWTALLSGITTTIGLASRVSMPILAISYTLFYHTLCSYSHFFHVGLIPLLILYVLVFFPAGASFSVDAMIRRRRGLAPIEAPPEVWSRGVHVAWLIYGLSYWAAGASKLSQPLLWNGETLRLIAVRDSDWLLEFDPNLSQRLVAWGLDAWVFDPAAIAVLIAEVCAIWVLFSDRARRWFPPILIFFHIGVVVLQGIVFFDLILLPLVFVPARVYRRIGAKLRLPVASEADKRPEIEAVIERRHHSFARLLLIATIPGLVLTGWMFQREQFPLLTQWGMFQQSFRGHIITSNRIFAVYADGHRERTDLTKQIRSLNNTRFRDTLGFPTAGPDKPRSRKAQIQRIHDIFNAAAAVHNQGLPEDQHLVRFEIVKIYWDMENDPQNPDWGDPWKTMTYEVGDAPHPEMAKLDRRIKYLDAKKKKAQKKQATAAKQQ
jgi:hypothetical protein